MLEIRQRDRHDFEMRSIPGVLFLFGVSMWHCSVFPEHAPAVGASAGAGGADGTGGAGDGGRGAAGTDGAAGTPGSGGESTGGSSGTGGASGGGGHSDAGDAGARDARAPDADAPFDGSTQSVNYVANVADCLEAVVAPQPGSCLSYSTLNDGPNELWVDIRRTGGRRAFTTYLSFAVDAAFANHTVLSVELRVTVTTHLNAPGTGADVWEVGPFNETSLYNQVPAVVGTAPLARTPGPALRGQTVTYSLPTRLAKPNTPVSVSLTLPNNGDGTGYWGTNGPTTQPPPTLVITYR